MLRIARQLRRFQQGEAATRLGISQAMLSRFENQLAGLSDDVLDRAVEVYDLPRSFFVQTDPILGAPVSVHPMWRRKASVSGREMDQIIAELNLRLMHLRRLLQAVDVETTFQVPNLPIEQFRSAEHVAGLVRAQWQMPAGPVQNLTRAVEAAGVVVVHSTLGGSAVDGVTFRAPGLPPLIVLNRDQPSDRMRFTLAHELAHLVMHHDQPTQSMEQEANEFASAFLLPARDIRPSFTRRIDLRLLAELKPVWRVSMASLLMRARSLNLLACNQERYLWQQFSITKIKQREPAELDFSVETPSILPELFDAHIRELGYSIADLAGALHIQPPELSNLYGLTVTPAQEAKTPHLRIVK
jgi:Zn-dependent peptidase ImmA (M78 family)/transcriptional regulator with XRE-family HTH domain